MAKESEFGRPEGMTHPLDADPDPTGIADVWSIYSTDPASTDDPNRENIAKVQGTAWSQGEVG